MLPIASRQWKKSSPEVFNFQGWLKCGTRERRVCKNEKLRSMLDKPPPTLSSSFCRYDFFTQIFFSLVMKSKHTWFEWIFCFLTNGKKDWRIMFLYSSSSSATPTQNFGWIQSFVCSLQREREGRVPSAALHDWFSQRKFLRGVLARYSFYQMNAS